MYIVLQNCLTGQQSQLMLSTPKLIVSNNNINNTINNKKWKMSIKCSLPGFLGYNRLHFFLLVTQTFRNKFTFERSTNRIKWWSITDW